MFDRLAELREKRENGEGGFTLIELLVVVVIIGILIAIAIPLYLNYQKSSNDKAAQSDLRNAVSVLETCNSDNGTYPTANFTATSGGAAGTCSQKINLSSGTTMNYYVNTSGTAGTSYSIVATNSNGNVTGGTKGYYCYAQAAGGSVAKKSASATPSAYAASC